MDRRSWLWLLALGSIWGASYMFIKIGLRDLSPAMVAFVRITLAAAVLMPLAAASGALRGLGGRAWGLTGLAAIQVAGPFYLIPLGEQHISSALAGILVATTPIFSGLLAMRVDHEERFEGLRLLGVVLGIVGVVTLFGLDLSGSEAAILGGLAVVLASVGYATGGFVLKHRFADARPLGLVACVMSASAVLLLPLALATRPHEVPGAGPMAALAALGVVGTGIAFVIFYALIARVGPSTTMVVSYVAPGFAILYGTLLLGEPLTAATVAGLALIVAGSWLAAGGRPPRRTSAVAAAPAITAGADGTGSAGMAKRRSYARSRAIRRRSGATR